MRSVDPVKRARAQEAAANMPPQDKRLPRPKQYACSFADRSRLGPAPLTRNEQTFFRPRVAGVRKTWRWRRRRCASCGNAWRWAPAPCRPCAATPSTTPRTRRKLGRHSRAAHRSLTSDFERGTCAGSRPPRLSSVAISKDSTLMSAGFSESFIQVYNLKRVRGRASAHWDAC